MGAQMAGIETIWNCEIDPFCRSILKKHFPNATQYTDITKLKKPPYTDIISGGFPCQDLSIANPKGDGLEGKRSGLWKEMFRIITETRPRYVLIENSTMLLNLSKIGYDAEWHCLQARDFNLPHKRERLFIVAYSQRIGCVSNIITTQKYQKSICKETAGNNNLPLPIKRFNARSDYNTVRMYNGFSTELDKNRIKACGNAVIPIIARFLFECIQEHNNRQAGR